MPKNSTSAEIQRQIIRLTYSPGGGVQGFLMRLTVTSQTASNAPYGRLYARQAGKKPLTPPMIAPLRNSAQKREVFASCGSVTSDGLGQPAFSALHRNPGNRCIQVVWAFHQAHLL